MSAPHEPFYASGGGTPKHFTREETSGWEIGLGVTVTLHLIRSRRAEEGRDGLGRAATPRFPYPLIKPDERISPIRLADRTTRFDHINNDTAGEMVQCARAYCTLRTRIILYSNFIDRN
jgi:hypothetical protein